MSEAEHTATTATASSQRNSKRRDHKRLIAALLIDLALALAASAKDANFLSNFAFFWLPHPLLLMILWSFKPRTHALIGNASGLALATLVFGVFGYLRPGNDASFWSWYLSAMPGAAVGGILGYMLIPLRKQQPSRRIITLTCIGTVLGMMITVATGIMLMQSTPPQKKDDKRSSPMQRRLQQKNDDSAGNGNIDYRIGVIEYRQTHADTAA